MTLKGSHAVTTSQMVGNVSLVSNRGSSTEGVCVTRVHLPLCRRLLQKTSLHVLTGTPAVASLRVCYLPQARVGRKEAEMAGRTPSSQARQGTSELEPCSIAQRRVVAVKRASRASPAPVHAPKFASPTPSESTGHRYPSLLSLTAQAHCSGSLLSLTAQARCSASLLSLTAQPHCSASLLSLTAQAHCSGSLLRLTAQPHCSASLLSLAAQPHCSASLLSPIIHCTCAGVMVITICLIMHPICAGINHG